MIYEKIRILKNEFYFDISVIADVLGITKESARVAATRYVKKGFLVRLKKNLYILSEKWENLSTTDRFLLANMLQVPSYISCMTALNFYGITTQVQIDFFESISIKRSKQQQIEGVIFNYYKIKKKFYNGFEKREKFFIATKEKAFLDAIYLLSFGKYKFDISSIDFNKLDRKTLKRDILKYPLKTQKTFSNIWKF